MLMERLLKSVFIISGDLNLQWFCLGVFHDPIEIFSPHPKAFNVVDRLIQKFRALVVQTRVVIDNTDDLFGFAHQNLHSKKHLVE